MPTHSARLVITEPPVRTMPAVMLSRRNRAGPIAKALSDYCTSTCVKSAPGFLRISDQNCTFLTRLWRFLIRISRTLTHFSPNLAVSRAPWGPEAASGRSLPRPDSTIGLPHPSLLPSVAQLP